jgi:hypothetical protein
VLDDQALELGNDRLVRPLVELLLDPSLDRGETKIVEARSLSRSERRFDTEERRASPELDRFAGRFLVRVEEVVEIELPRLDAQAVAVADRLDPVRPQELAQSVNRHLERVLSLCRRILAPERVDRRVPPDDPVRVQEQEGEQGTLTRTADRQRRTAAEDLEWSQQPKLKLFAPVPGGHRPVSLP